MNSTTLKEQRTAFWLQHIARANQYPEGIKIYCKANGLSLQTFYKWKLRLTGKNNKIPAVVRSPNSFAEVKVCEPEVAPKQILPDAKWLAQFILHLTEITR